MEDGPSLDEAVVPPSEPGALVDFAYPPVHGLPDRRPGCSVRPEAAQSWSLTWDQFDQLLKNGSQATPTDFDRIDLGSGVLVSVGNIDIQIPF